MCSSDCSNKNDVKELLEWELSLDSRDLRAHAWYHGNITRQTAESLFQNDGDFLVRDCSSSSTPGDYVLSCRWKHNNLHFIVHRDILQKDTIYEQLRYRFEFDSFDTVSDLITYHVGSGIPISAASGVLIYNPKNRGVPISRGNPDISHGARSDYVTLNNASGILDPVPAFSYLDKVSTLERNKQPSSLNLTPPPGLLEELGNIPIHIQHISEKFEKYLNLSNGSAFDLTSFQSILLPTCTEDVRMDSNLLETMSNILLRTSDRTIAWHLTKLDWEVLTGALDESLESLDMKGLFSLYFHNSQHRWDNVIERSLTMSHFVVLMISISKKPEETLDKWMTVAGELKTSFGNFFSFCSIMRGLLMPVITRTNGKVNWIRLRSEFTDSTFTFETLFRSTFQGLVQGTEPYPPNTCIPELLSGALILEDALELLPVSCIAGEEDQLKFMTDQLNDLRNVARWDDIQRKNIQRHLSDTFMDFDIVLTDMLRTELQLMVLWGKAYNGTSLKSRCESFDKIMLGLCN